MSNLEKCILYSQAKKRKEYFKESGIHNKYNKLVDYIFERRFSSCQICEHYSKCISELLTCDIHECDIHGMECANEQKS